MKTDESPEAFDAIVIGSGFAGAVTACRLAEAGLGVCILERGRRFDANQDFPVHPAPTDPNVPSDAPEDGRDAVQPDLSRMFWKLGKGVWDFRDLGEVVVGQAAGYGGGSLIYANVHLRPPQHTFDERWRVDGCDDAKQPYFQRGQLEPYFDLAAKMLDVAPLEGRYVDIPKRVQLERAASNLNGGQDGCRGTDGKVEELYLRTISTPLAVNFKKGLQGLDGKPRGVCDLKGNCCLGCKQGAKNTLDLNYLYRAETATPPAEVRTFAEVTCIEGLESTKWRFAVAYRDHREGGASETVYTNYVFLCAGAINTTELLMRSYEAGKLELTGNGLGTRFQPNQDTLSVVFDCDEPQELDRGPTITSTLLYDRKPKGDEPTARWRLTFRDGAFDPAFGSKLTTGTDQNLVAEVASPAYVVSGSFQQENAIGEIMLTNVTRKLEKGEALFIDGQRWCRVDATPHQIRHWFVIQDGGSPVDFEPWLGVFRSPLWLGRNAFREEKRPRGREDWPLERGSNDPSLHDHIEHASASQKIGYATLPIEALTNVISGLTRGSPERGMPEASELGAQRLYRLSGAHSEREHTGPWKLLPTQLDDAFDKLKQRALDTVGLGAESIVSSFLDDAAESLSKKLGEGLDTIARPSDEPSEMLTDFGKNLGKIDKKQFEQFNQLGLARGALQLGAQLLWGSQSGLARAIGDQLWETNFAGRGKLAEAAVDLLTRLLDYRLGNGRTAMLLSMGIDSAPGRLHLDLPAEPRLGSELLGQESGSRAYILGTKLDEGTSFGAGNAAGSLVVAGATGPFKVDEVLFAGRKKLGRFQADDCVMDWPSHNGKGVHSNITPLRLRALRYEPVPLPESKSKPDRVPPPPALSAGLQAKLPDAIDTPERGVQERVLRDIASAWGGELRTDPLWTFFDRRITVHPQGGCPMGPEDRAVTKPTGEVHGCDGLYVMDAAAFPGPVGANPSATIAAIAEYKASKLIERWQEEEPQLLRAKARGGFEDAIERLRAERDEAKKWVDAQPRAIVDPLGSGTSEPQSVEPVHRPVGIEFTEKMEGAVDRRGRWEPVTTELTVRIDDLADFLARHARGVEVPIPVIEGTLAIGKERGLIRDEKRAGNRSQRSGGKAKSDECDLDPSKSFIVVMARPGLDDDGNEVRTIDYHLVARNHRRILDGKKTIRDDPGFDAWEDTTRLDIESLKELDEKGKEIRQSKGELLLPAAAFFDLQLRSFKADTDDPARQMWAMVTFGRFFFGHLAAVYLPKLDRLGGLASNLMRRGHG